MSLSNTRVVLNIVCVCLCVCVCVCVRAVDTFILCCVSKVLLIEHSYIKCCQNTRSWCSGEQGEESRPMKSDSIVAEVGRILSIRHIAI